MAYVDFRRGNHRLLVFRSPEIGGNRPRSAVSRSIGRRFESSRAHHPSPLKSISYAAFRRESVDNRSPDLWGVASEAAQNGGGGGGEGNSKKRTLRFLHWGSLVDPFQSPIITVTSICLPVLNCLSGPYSCQQFHPFRCDTGPSSSKVNQ